MLIALDDICDDGGDEDDEEVLFLCYIRWRQLVVEPNIEIERPFRLNGTIDSFTDSQCWTLFAFRKMI